MASKFLLCSDIHLDHARDRGPAFLQRVRDLSDPDSVLLVTGDTTNFHHLWEHHDVLAQASRGRVLYVLGNHDLWGGSFAGARTVLRPHALEGGHAVFMDLVERVRVDHETCVVGESGWYDGRNGQQGNPAMLMNDWYFVAEYRGKDARAYSAEVADARAALMERKLLSAVEAGAKRVIALTHVPPFVEACRHLGGPSDVEALPWFSSRIMGDTLESVALSNPDVMFEVLCGHTHDAFVHRRAANLVVHVTGAEYGDPRVEEWVPTLW